PAAPLATTGTLVVIGLPSGSRMQVDGKMVDATNPVAVDPGTHRVTAQATGYENYSTSVLVARGVQVPLTVTMTRSPGKPAAGGGGGGGDVGKGRRPVRHAFPGHVQSEWGLLG